MTIAQKIKHLQKIGFSSDLTEVAKFYAGKKFNRNDPAMQNLIQRSVALWQEYSRILQDLARAIATEKVQLLARKEELLSMAFPEHGYFGNLCDGFYCTIGAVDFAKVNMPAINKNVKLGPYTLVKFGNNVLVGQDVQIGVTLGTDVPPNRKVRIANDTWLCASTLVGAGATVSRGAIVALGACLYPQQKTEVNALVVGNPAKTKLVINENYQSTKDNRTQRSPEEIKYLVQHVRRLGLEADDAFLNALNGEKYNCFSLRMAQITQFSHDLSYEYNHPATTKKRRREIIDILFPIQGENFQIGQGLFVDVLGLAKIGNNVQIGDNAYFAGNVVLGDNVRAGSDLVLAGIGHELPVKLRRVRQFQGTRGEVCEVGKIYVGNDVTIGEHCTLAPGCELTQDLPSHRYVIGKNKVFAKVVPDKTITKN